MALAFKNLPTPGLSEGDQYMLTISRALRSLENLDNLEKSGNFFLIQEFFILVVFTLSSSILVPVHFLGLPNTTGKNVKKVREFLKICCGKRGNFFENSPENPDKSILKS